MFQEQAHDAKLKATSPEDTEDPMIPLPSQGQQSARRRGGISAEPVTEEDATSYVKKVYFVRVYPCLPYTKIRIRTMRCTPVLHTNPCLCLSYTKIRIRMVRYAPVFHVNPCLPHTKKRTRAVRYTSVL